MGQIFNKEIRKNVQKETPWFTKTNMAMYGIKECINRRQNDTGERRRKQRTIEMCIASSDSPSRAVSC